jgi:arylsulfatase A-like enzyme
MPLLAVCGWAHGDEGRPNVLVIIADGMGWGDPGIHGNGGITTPHLDALAESGLRLERFHVCPSAAPTMASLLTGRYHYRTGVSGDNRGEGILHGHEITMADCFGRAGYATGLFGKWLHGSNWPHHPNARGFDTFFGSCDNPLSSDQDLECERDGVPLPTKGRITDVIADEAIAFMKARADAGEPFLCVVPFHAPVLTSPVAGSPDGADSAKVMMESMDANTGRLMACLKAGGVRENTIVWFLSNHGPDVPPGAKNPRYNGHLRGAKGSVHEGGVRVPSFVIWPGRIPAGSKFRRITAHLDLLPTLLGLCGIAPDDRSRMDGMNLSAALTSGGQPPRWPNRLLFTAWTPPGYAVGGASVAVRTDRWLALRDPVWRRGAPSETHSGWELYDLNADPHELTDLSDDYPFLLSDMRADFSRWMDETTDDGLGPIPTEIGHDEWPTVTLRARDAVTPEGWATDPDRTGALTRWTDPAHAATWPVKVIGEGGRHAIEIEYTLPPQATPCRMRLRLGDSMLDFTIDQPAGPEPRRIRVGEMTLATGDGELRLQALDLKQQAIDFRRLWITRVEEAQKPALRD